MKRISLFFFAAALAAVANAQTPAKPAAASSTTAKTSGAVRSTASSALALPAGIPRVAHGPLKAAFTLKYEDIKIGTGAEAEPNKLYKVFYTGYLGANGRADDGKKFDSSDDHRRPVLDKDGKPVLGEDGKPKLGEPQPLEFPQGFGRLIPGFDQGFDGMHIGGKRRLFIPWQLAYGARGRPGPDADHPGIPPKADLIFDVELVDAVDLPMPPARPGMSTHPMPGGIPPHPPVPPAGAAAPASPGTTSAQPAAPSQPAPPSTPPPSSTTPPQPK
jgi:peptidylprolyl isomerase